MSFFSLKHGVETSKPAPSLFCCVFTFVLFIFPLVLFLPLTPGLFLPFVFYTTHHHIQRVSFKFETPLSSLSRVLPHWPTGGHFSGWDWWRNGELFLFFFFFFLVKQFLKNFTGPIEGRFWHIKTGLGLHCQFSCF